MGIMDKVKELGEEIIKTVDESGIKENVKCATMVIKDTVEKGKKEIETKIEENKQKIEEQKKFLKDLEDNVEENVAMNFEIGKEAININELIDFGNVFTEKICAINKYSKELKISFGKYSSEKAVSKMIENWNEKSDDNTVETIEVIVDQGTENEITVELNVEEKPVICYYGGRKEYFLLTDKNLYFKMKHPDENLVYHSKVSSDKIQVIDILKEKDKNILLLNDVRVGLLDEEVAELLVKYLNKINSNDLTITPDDIIEEIKKVKFVSSEVVLNLIEDLRN